MPRVGVIIVAAGASTRMDGIDKIFAPLHGRPLLAWSVDAFEQSDLVSQIVIAVDRHKLAEGRALVEECGWSKVRTVCRGGLRRQDSVREALWRLGPCDWVAVHDGARPCVNPALLAAGLEAAEMTGAAAPGLPIHDTVRRVGEDRLSQGTIDRAGLWAIQTPQLFRYDLLTQAHRTADASIDVTDDAALLEQQGVPVAIFPGDPFNLKVTTPQDLELAESYLAGRSHTAAPTP